MLIFGSPYPQLDMSSITFCVTRNRLLFEVHEIISRLLRDFFLIFVQKADLFLQKADFLRKKKTLFVLFFQKGLLSRPRSAKADPVGITAYAIHRHRQPLSSLTVTSVLDRDR